MTLAPAENTLKHPPIVPGLPLIGSTLPLAREGGVPIKFMAEVTEKYGDVVEVKSIGGRLYIVTDPELLHEIYVKRYQDFHKPIVASERMLALARFLGDGILTADHHDWRPQRKLIQPFMHARRIEAYVETMVSLAQALFDSFQPGEIRDIHTDMTQVTLSIIARTIFGMDADPSPRLMELSHIGQAITLEESTMPLPEWLSGSRNRRAAEVNEGLDALVNTIMTERRKIGHESRTDLLSLLMQSTDEAGNPVPDEFVRNNILTLYFAGHETTANTLTWALAYLNQNPDAAEKLRAEVDNVLGDRLPTLEDLPNLRYAEMVFKETMRIEPTVATLVRFVADDVPLGPYQLKGGSTLFTPIYVVHHDPRWWDAPHEFRPERFSAENEPNIPKFAYFPFGGGPRICIGNHFAMMEGQILLAMLMQRWNLALASGTMVDPWRQITTAPRNGVKMTVSPRQA